MHARMYLRTMPVCNKDMCWPLAAPPPFPPPFSPVCDRRLIYTYACVGRLTPVVVGGNAGAPWHRGCSGLFTSLCIWAGIQVLY